MHLHTDALPRTELGVTYERPENRLRRKERSKKALACSRDCALTTRTAVRLLDRHIHFLRTESAQLPAYALADRDLRRSLLIVRSSHLRVGIAQ